MSDRLPAIYRNLKLHAAQGAVETPLEPHSGEHISALHRRAAKQAVVTGTDTAIIFNDRPGLVTNQQAQEVFSVENQTKRIRLLIERKARLEREAAEVEAEIWEEYGFSKRLHGDKFPNSL